MFDKGMIEIFDYLEHRHEIRFMFEGKEYNFINKMYDDFIQLDLFVENDDKFYEDVCIASGKSKSTLYIDDECIEKIFNEKCFNGKSFTEIVNLVEVVAIF